MCLALTIDDAGVTMIDWCAFADFTEADAQVIGLWTYAAADQGGLYNVDGRTAIKPSMALGILRRMIAAGSARPEREDELIGALQRAGIHVDPRISGDRIITATIN